MSHPAKKSERGKRFDRLESAKRLKVLAKTPVDLTGESVDLAGRVGSMYAEACGLKLLYGTERVNAEVMEALCALALESGAVDKMARMQAGEVVNKIEGQPSEKRAVLHTAMRILSDVSSWSGPAAEAASLAQRELKKLKAFLNEIDRAGRFSEMIMVGIGGSDLGPRALYLALEAFHLPGRKVTFLSNVDPDDAAAVRLQADLSRSLVVVVSKSGTTLETATNEALLRQRFLAAGLKPQEHFIAVTGEGSPMDNKLNYRECFTLWDYVGGRYSATSMVGGVMLAFGLGFEVFVELLRGAHAMDQVALERDSRKNLPLLGALLGVWNRNFLGYPTVAVIPYSQALSRFPAHLQQCDMESNGKRIDKRGKAVTFPTGPVVWGEPGTNGQHSFFQLLHQGTDVVPVEFIGFKESQRGEDLDVQGTSSQQKLLSNLMAQSLALAKGQKNDNPNQAFPGNRPNHLLWAKKLTPFTLGALLAYYEHKVAFQGFIWNINSFDQEGVQLGKVLAHQFLEHFRSVNARSDGAPLFAEGQALLRQLEL